jgi:hypothetical protein
LRGRLRAEGGRNNTHLHGFLWLAGLCKIIIGFQDWRMNITRLFSMLKTSATTNQTEKLS